MISLPVQVMHKMRVMLLADSLEYPMFMRTLYKSTVSAFPKAQLLGYDAIRILGADKTQRRMT